MALNFPSCSFNTSFVYGDEEPCRLRCEIDQSFDYSFFSGWEVGDYYGCAGGDSRLTDIEWASDPVNLLPDDPFGMGLNGEMGAAIADFLEANGRDFFSWKFCCSLESQFNYDGWTEDCDVWPNESFAEMSVREAQYENSESGFIVDEGLNCNHAEEARVTRDDEGLPHEAIGFSLAYLDLQDLLSVEGVCRSLRFAVQNDALLWRSIQMDPRVSSMITDESLLRLTDRAQGNLQSLSLFGCLKITDDGLKRVLDSNPRLKKLSVAGCVRLGLDNIINNLKMFQLQGLSRIEHLKLGTLFCVSKEQYGELKLLLGIDEHQPKAQNPRFYHIGKRSFGFDDDCVLDIELCPVCQTYKHVYDCPSERCQGEVATQCRACIVCISRCSDCGKCIKDCRYVETFCLEYVCLECWGVPLNEDFSFESTTEEG